MYYLDDGVVAGDLPALIAAVTQLQHQASQVGLTLQLAKCEAIAAGATIPANLMAHFSQALLYHPNGSSRVLCNFEGENNFCEIHTAKRAGKAQQLLEGLAASDDPQVGLRLLCTCVGFTRMVHSMRYNPPIAQQYALATFEQIIGSILMDSLISI